MRGLQIFFLLIIPLITSGQVTDFLKSSGSTIRANSQTANIFIDGKLVGQGEVSGVKIKRDECITVQVSEVGYITQIKEFCRKKGMPSMEKTEFIAMPTDDSFEASERNDYANNDIIINPKEKDVNKSWLNAIRLITNYFDALEVNDNDVRYLRTAWVVNVFGNYTIRSRLIFRLTDENPVEYRFKLVSERARGEASPREDEKFKSWDRVLKRYNPLIEEIQSRL